jgi:hypothetical protein
MEDDKICDVATPLWAKCEGQAHTPKSGKLESSMTPLGLLKIQSSIAGVKSPCIWAFLVS